MNVKRRLMTIRDYNIDEDKIIEICNEALDEIEKLENRIKELENKLKFVDY